MWYIRLTLAVFRLFSDHMTVGQDFEISRKLLKTPSSEEREDSVLVLDGDAEFVDLIDESSRLLLNLVPSGESTWLEKPHEEWVGDESDQRFKAVVASIKTTNDVAERGIGMLKDSADSVRKPAQFKWLLQAVERHSAQLPTLSKAALGSV